MFGTSGCQLLFHPQLPCVVLSSTPREAAKSSKFDFTSHAPQQLQNHPTIPSCCKISINNCKPKKAQNFQFKLCGAPGELLISRHTVVCRAAQEAGAPHREYIDRKNENVIFTPLYLGDHLSDWNQICYTVARQPRESTFQI